MIDAIEFLGSSIAQINHRSSGSHFLELCFWHIGLILTLLVVAKK
jgi:hypothetical protein